MIKKMMIGIFIASLLFFCSSIDGFVIKNLSNNKSFLCDCYGDLTIYFIDVGQGDSILIQTPEDNFVLIDTGSRTYADVVINFLNDLNVNTITAFVATHPHEDHIGGCEEIFLNFDILSVYHPGFDYSSQTYMRFLSSIDNEGCPVYTDDEVDPGDFIDISYSVSCQIVHINKYASTANDAGIVLKLKYSSISALFTGDIHGEYGDNVESYLVNNWDVDVDILKVTHHGSRYGSTNYFLDEATPDVSIICCGEGNSYGHPHQETLDRLSRHNSLIYRTDENCDIKIKSDGYSYSVFYEKPEDTPLKPAVSGPVSGITGIEYMFTAKTTDPNGDQIFYLWDWNDGEISEWIGPYISGEEVNAYHKWMEDGTYMIKVKSKDEYNHESEWGFFGVIMPRNIFLQKLFLLTKIKSSFF